MRHRVNMVDRELNFVIEESDLDSDASEGTKLRRALQKKAREGFRNIGRRKRVDSDGNELERDEEDDEEWQNLKTGGQVQLVKRDGHVAQGTTGKVIANRRNFGRNN